MGDGYCQQYQPISYEEFKKRMKVIIKHLEKQLNVYLALFYQIEQKYRAVGNYGDLLQELAKEILQQKIADTLEAIIENEAMLLYASRYKDEVIFIAECDGTPAFVPKYRVAWAMQRKESKKEVVAYT